MVYADTDAPGGAATVDVPVPDADRNRFSLEDDELLELARSAVIIEQHYSTRSGRPVPMDIEWAKDGDSGELFIIQARPETVHSAQPVGEFETWHLQRRAEVIARGKSVGRRIGCGRTRVIVSPRQMRTLQPGEVLVTDITDPDWEPVMKLASAIVTNRGGRTCHAAIVARELGIPAVVGTGDGTARIPRGEIVTVSCAEGDTGYVYRGELPCNALLADAFLELCDGFSIGSNDLTQLTLGMDRDSALIEGLDERDPAVLALMDMAIGACRRRGKYIGICGQAPSDYPQITRWLVERGIDSISLNPDSIPAMTALILQTERQLAARPIPAAG